MKKNAMNLFYLIVGMLIGMLLLYIVSNITTNKKNVATGSSNEISSSSLISESQNDESSKLQNEQEINNLEIKKDHYKDVLYELEEEGEEYQTKLMSGNYVVGVDIPIGTYKVNIINGTGIIDIENQTQGVFISSEMSLDSDIFEDAYKSISNVRLYDNTIIKVVGIEVELISENAKTSLLRDKTQNIEELNEVNLSSVYEIGKDIKAGVYDIQYIEGFGNVITEGLDNGGIDADFIEGEELSKVYKNIELVEGTKLIVNGVKIKLIPSDRGFEINKE